MISASLRLGLSRRVKAALPVSVLARLVRTDGLRPIPAGIWNEQFGSGEWDYLAKLSEVPRYSVVSGYFNAAAPGGSVLDVGCGAGLLQPWLLRAGYIDYQGVDLSSTAIAKAQSMAGERAVFEAGDAEEYVPSMLYDAIVFNEMLYYLKQPRQAVERYSQFLKPSGVFIISLWHCRESWRAWEAVKQVVTVIDEVRVVRSDISWKVTLARPAR